MLDNFSKVHNLFGAEYMACLRSEYWKSLPRKFCDACKCWFADNKASIDFHERGKRHQENAQKRIVEIQRKGIKDFKKQKQLEDDMEKIEKAALAAYKKDLLNNAEAVTSVSDITLKLVENSSPVVSKTVEIKKAKKQVQKDIKASKTSSSNVVLKKWYEAMSEEGHTYYWNIETSKTQWEPPTEGYLTIQEQEASELAKSAAKNVSEEHQNGKISSSQASTFGPQPKVDPYGAWVTVEKEVVEDIDWQLPKSSEDVVEVVIPVAKDEPKLKFREKVIGSLDDDDDSGEIVSFKKRKFTCSSKNVRKRTTDDD